MWVDVTSMKDVVGAVTRARARAWREKKREDWSWNDDDDDVVFVSTFLYSLLDKRLRSVCGSCLGC